MKDLAKTPKKLISTKKIPLNQADLKILPPKRNLQIRFLTDFIKIVL